MQSLLRAVRLTVLIGGFLVATTPVAPTPVFAGEQCQPDPCPECNNPNFWMLANMECMMESASPARDICYTTTNPQEGCCDHVATICEADDPELSCANYGAGSCKGN